MYLYLFDMCSVVCSGTKHVSHILLRPETHVKLKISLTTENSPDFWVFRAVLVVMT